MPVRHICDNCQHFGLIMDCWACLKHKKIVFDQHTCSDWAMRPPSHGAGCECAYCQEYNATKGVGGHA